jgi:hypothetical protein
VNRHSVKQLASAIGVSWMAGEEGRRWWIDSCRQGGTYRDVFPDVRDGERALFPGDIDDGSVIEYVCTRDY